MIERDDWDLHWEQYAQAASANPAQQMRHRIIARLLQAAASAGDVLRVCDFGSGQGDLICGLARVLPGAEFVGLELSTSGVSAGVSWYPQRDSNPCYLRERQAS